MLTCDWTHAEFCKKMGLTFCSVGLAQVRMQALVLASLAHWARFRLAQGFAAFQHKVTQNAC